MLTNEITFMLNYTDYPERMTAEKSADDMLDPGLDNAFSAYPHGRKESAKIGLQGFPGRRFSIEDPDSGYTTIAKSCLVGHRIYLVQAVMPTKLSGQPDLLARPINVLSVDPEPASDWIRSPLYARNSTKSPSRGPQPPLRLRTLATKSLNCDGSGKRSSFCVTRVFFSSAAGLSNVPPPFALWSLMPVWSTCFSVPRVLL